MIKRKSLRRMTSVMRLRAAALLTVVVCGALAPLPRNLPFFTTKAYGRRPAAAPASPAQRVPSPSASPANTCAPISKVKFSEETFPPSDWDASVLPGGMSLKGYDSTQVAAGGNPNDFRGVHITKAAPDSHFAHLMRGYSFDPAVEGGVVAIDGAYDLKNRTREGAAAAFAPLLRQNGFYYRGPSDVVSANRWTRFNHPGMKATDFVNVSREGPRNPTFTCDGQPIEIGFVVIAGTSANAVVDAGVDNLSLTFNATCCSAAAALTGGAAVDDRSSVNSGVSSPRGPLAVATAPGSSKAAAVLGGARAGLPAAPRSGGPRVREERGEVTSRCCCDDDAVTVDGNGTVALPAETDMGSPPIFEYVEQDLGEVSDLYPGADTTTDTWCQKYPCRPAVGGTVPPEAKVVPRIAEEISTDEAADHLREWEKEIADRTKTAPNWTDRAAPDYTPPLKPHQPERRGGNQYAFGGRDIVFIHGLKLEHILDRIGGVPGATADWQQPASFPADTTNPEFYTGYYHRKAMQTWSGNSSLGTDGHIAEFLRSKGFRNRFLVVSYDCSERLDVNVRAVLAQIGDAMVYGTGVVDPLNPGAPVRDFGTPSFVIVSHSTGGPVTDVALSAAARHPGLRAAYIPKYCKAHIAVQGAHGGSGLATAALALSGDAGVVAPQWLADAANPLLQQLGGPTIPTPSGGHHAFSRSILVDLVPRVMQHQWGPYIRTSPVRTLTVVGAHPTVLRPFKYTLLPGFDDGVVTINSQVANPNDVALWPSGFRTDGAGLVQNFDMGVFGIGPNTNVSVSIGGGGPISFSVNISNTSLNSPIRAAGYYVDQKGDRVSSPANVIAFPQPFFFAAGATPYISPTGMIQTISSEFGGGSGQHPLSASPLNRTPNIFSFIQSASDHFKGTHDHGPQGIYAGFNGVWYANSPYAAFNGEHNFEETRVITDTAVYAPVPMPYGDNEPLLRPQNVPPVIEKIRGLRVTFTVRFFKKTKTRTLWVWKRRYHLLAGWETKRQFDYVYESVLKN
jgi:hypothetical protein